MRSSKEAFIGDTLRKTSDQVDVLQGFQPPKPMVFAGIYPFDQSQHVNLRSAIEKVALNDSAVSVAIDTRFHFVIICFAVILFGCFVVLR